MLSCKQIVKILSSDENLSMMKKAELKMHLMMCKHCSNYSSQLKMLKNGFKQLFSNITKVEPAEVKDLEEKVIEKNFRKSGG